MGIKRHISPIIGCTALLLLLLAAPFGVRAQQDAQFTQYMYNTLSINPAYAGTRGVLSATGVFRSQWVGLDGAPNSQTFNIHTPYKYGLGLGFSIINDEIGNGTNQDTYFDLAVSYTVPVSETAKLAFGLKGGGHSLNIDFNQLRNYSSADMPMIEPAIDNKFSPNFGAGVYLHTPRYYAGLSVPNFFATEHFQSSGSSRFVAEERMNIYLMGGAVYDLGTEFKVKPAFLLKAVSGAPLQADISANLFFQERFSIGAAYRLSAAVSGLFSYQLTNQLMLGVAYDWETAQLGSTAFNNGSVELFLRYEFIKGFDKLITPRFF